MIGIVCAFFHTEGKGFYSNHAENYRKDPEGYENVIAQFVEEHSGALKKEY